MVLTVVAILVVLVLVGVLFVNLSPEFGGSPTKAQKERFKKSDNFKDGVFVNLGDVKMKMGFDAYLKGIKGYFSPQPNAIPSKNVSVSKIDSLEVARYTGAARLVWFGHSTFLLQLQGKNILLDPMLGSVPAPNPMLGGKRFSENLPIDIERLPEIDAVIFSHDHYDHLDYGSVQLLKNRVKMFYTPLGVGAHLMEWGVKENRIVELDWWDEVQFDDIRLKCTPAQHFSGRGLSDRGKTLWSGWVIQSDSSNIFFSGDSGYGSHFKEIGEKYGPFDFAMLECGQYNELWKEIHMMPEQTAQAGLDVRANKIMPIHWGAFKLAMHPWTEPVQRVSKKAKELGVPVTTPRIGEIFYLDSTAISNEEWWKDFN